MPFELGGIQADAFLDAGTIVRDTMRVWSDGPFQDLKLGFCAGIRFRISVFSIKLDFAKPLSATSDKTWKFILGLGTDF